MAFILCAALITSMAMPVSAETEDTVETVGGREITASEVVSNETAVYDNNDVTVSSVLREVEYDGTYDGSIITSTVKNNSASTVCVLPWLIVANDVILEEPLELDLSFEATYEIESTIGICESAEDVSTYMGYVPAGEEIVYSKTIDTDALLKFYSDETIEKIEVSYAIAGLSTEPEFGTLYTSGTGYTGGYAFLEQTDLTELEIPDSSWDGTWETPDGNVLYDENNIRIIDAGPRFSYDGTFHGYYDVIVENKSDDTIELDSSLDDSAVFEFDGQTVERSQIHTRDDLVLPGTRSLAQIGMSYDYESDSAPAAHAEFVLTKPSYRDDSDTYVPAEEIASNIVYEYSPE